MWDSEACLELSRKSTMQKQFSQKSYTVYNRLDSKYVSGTGEGSFKIGRQNKFCKLWLSINCHKSWINCQQLGKRANLKTGVTRKKAH